MGQHGRALPPSQSKNALCDTRQQSDPHADLDGQIVRAKGVINESTSQCAHKTAHLVAHERDATEHGLPAQSKGNTEPARDQGCNPKPQKSHECGKDQSRVRCRVEVKIKTQANGAKNIDQAQDE